VRGPSDQRLDAVADRVRAAIATALRQAHQARTVRRSVTADDVMLAVGMVAALVAKTPAADRQRTAGSAWSLLRRGMRP
jgi:hypothetical protein